MDTKMFCYIFYIYFNFLYFIILGAHTKKRNYLYLFAFGVCFNEQLKRILYCDNNDIEIPQTISLIAKEIIDRFWPNQIVINDENHDTNDVKTVTEVTKDNVRTTQYTSKFKINSSVKC